ncbi:hypothetical protein AGRA3207_003838 [Actinomadura graeca]|uniref:Uncharacterized protein n=1 Tax=Actinomadura graeca TaxID=2750812 RepID=A0ABX8QXS9_9ACTN|nr:hypothetical protein [Actinomadura graeca]QXJ22779.1 hypothetical protein AGRA3207_003838 [Actinomadura graeca]
MNTDSSTEGKYWRLAATPVNVADRGIVRLIIVRDESVDHEGGLRGMAHEYTVVTPHGDVHLTTENHHSAFGSIHDFLEHHKTEISAAVGVTSVGLQILSLYLSHGRRGPRLG